MTYPWWLIPALLTVLGTLWSVFIVPSDDELGRIPNLLALTLTFALTTVVWAVAGALK